MQAEPQRRGNNTHLILSTSLVNARCRARCTTNTVMAARTNATHVKMAILLAVDGQRVQTSPFLPKPLLQASHKGPSYPSAHPSGVHARGMIHRYNSAVVLSLRQKPGFGWKSSPPLHKASNGHGRQAESLLSHEYSSVAHHTRVMARQRGVVKRGR